MNPTTAMAQKFKALLAQTTREDFNRQWAAIRVMGMQGPTLEEIYNFLNKSNEFQETESSKPE